MKGWQHFVNIIQSKWFLFISAPGGLFLKVMKLFAPLAKLLYSRRGMQALGKSPSKQSMLTSAYHNSRLGRYMDSVNCHIKLSLNGYHDLICLNGRPNSAVDI